MSSLPAFGTSLGGSFPQTDHIDTLCEQIVAAVDVPAWPQLPRRSFLESMYVQYSRALPALVLDEVNEKVFFDTGGDLDLERFYEAYLAEDLAAFALEPAYAAGFDPMLAALRNSPGEWVKGHVSGPISLGLIVTDRALRASLYDETLADVILKNAAMAARWQVRALRQVRPQVIMFVDEPYLASFGSAFISLSREEVVARLDEVFIAIHAEDGLAGVHCCGNTDWGVLLATTVDILNLDAYGYLANLALYPAELRAFLDRGGVVAWGIVPNNEEIFKVTPGDLARRLWQGFDLIEEKARRRGVEIRPEELAACSLVTPSCGLGSTRVEVAGQVLETLSELGKELRRGR